MKKFFILPKRMVEKEEQMEGMDKIRGEARQDYGYDVEGWTSVIFGHSDEDRGHGSDCGRSWIRWGFIRWRYGEVRRLMWPIGFWGRIPGRG